MAIKLQLKGSQQLTITPVMHYFIQLLTNNHLELIETLQNEVEANPMLEIETVEKANPETEPNDFEQRMERADASFITPYEEQGFLKKKPRRYRQKQGPGSDDSVNGQPGRSSARASHGHVQQRT